MTSDAIDSAISPFSVRLKTAWRGLVVPGWLFAILAILLLGFLILFGLLVVISLTYFGAETRSPDRVFDCGWALLCLFALVWALANLFWLTKAAGVKSAVACYGHLAMAIGCGLIAVGIHSVLFARSFGTQPIIMDYSDRGLSVASSAGPSAPAVAGDAEEGRKIFSTACITCHGPTGGGMPNLAPALRGSVFIASADPIAIANVIRLGRAPTDPNSKTKKVMPARGGNPFLGDDKISHLVAFVRAIQNEEPSAAIAGQDANAPPPVQLAKWVIPAPPAAPAGMIRLTAREDIGDAQTIALRHQRRRQGLVQTLSLGLSGIHYLFLVGVMIATSQVLLRGMVNDSPRLANETSVPHETSDDDSTLWSFSLLGWGVATLAWLVVFLYAFVMT